MAKRYRVGVIGRTGKGNYGHGLDTIWLEYPDRVEVVAVADENETGRNAAQKRLKCRRPTPISGLCSARKKLDIVAVAIATSINTRIWCWPALRLVATFSSKNRLPEPWLRRMRWLRPASAIRSAAQWPTRLVSHRGQPDPGIVGNRSNWRSCRIKGPWKRGPAWWW